MLEGSPSWHEVLAIIIIWSAIFAAFGWMLHNRIWALENECKTLYPPGTVVVRRRRKYD